MMENRNSKKIGSMKKNKLNIKIKYVRKNVIFYIYFK